MSSINEARNDDAGDDGQREDGQVASQGPVPDEAEDVSDAGEGTLAAEPGNDREDAPDSDE